MSSLFGRIEPATALELFSQAFSHFQSFLSGFFPLIPQTDCFVRIAYATAISLSEFMHRWRFQA